MSTASAGGGPAPGSRRPYVVRRAAEDRRGYRSAIRLIDGDDDIALTAGLGRDWAPRWSPDGRSLAFLSDRAGGVQLWLVRPGGGEPVRLTQLPGAPGPATWSPDGRRLCFTAAVADGPGQDQPPGYADDVRVIRRLHHKTNGIGLHADRHQQVFVCDLKGSCRAVTSGPYDHVRPAWQHYLDSSPLTYVDRIHTPLLILHSEQDLRCPIEQAEQLYTALKRLGRTVEFVRYPDENHELSRSGQPRHRVDRLWRIVRWFEGHLGDGKRNSADPRRSAGRR